ncbi:bone morphogenetic protein 3 [Gadus chalcogrammus]|uniref:bone morphogenetic protein 3 n=1 Tax=Gadus chalcogrammus TaxID=1042646 RepID=UPI0024C3E5E2|nr:bone morphogenetic protein 3 [Gadus chalcogrammus]
MAVSFGLAVLWLYGWSYLCVGDCAMLKDNLASKRLSEFTQKSNKLHGRDVLSQQDTMTEHMQMLYAKYNQAGFPFKDGNTVRSFKARWGTVKQKELQLFNLTSLTKSEAVLSATLHYYIGDLQDPAPQGCARPRSCSRPRARTQNPVQMVVWTFASVNNHTRTLGHFLVNVSTLNRDIISWQWKDVTRVVNQAKHHDELLIGIQVTSRGQGPWKTLLPERPPYILVYANDSAISEPESVVSTLQRHHAVVGEASLAPGFHQLGLNVLNNTAWQRVERRRRRSVNTLLPLQNNELPGPEYPFKTPTWDDPGPYDPLDAKPDRRPRKKSRKNQRNKMPLLQFDEHTIKKARKKQWVEPRNCARRYLKVDFADIGWSEWIISPKSFDAYFCSGSCQFPMPKGLKPSNHATIQSIVRAVGVVPGIPEPCCVPEKMSPLSILFFDQDKNVVLKVYPNMTVDSCACR